MARPPTLRTAMTPFPYTVELDAPIGEAHAMMRRHGVRHLPVKDGSGSLVGVVTDRDLKSALGPYLSGGVGGEALVRDAAVLDAFTTEITTPLAYVAAAMADERYGSVLVTKEGRLAGIFTAVDACRLLAEILADAPGDDAA